MKRLAGAALGLFFAQVCYVLGLPHRGTWRIEQPLRCWGREEGLTSPAHFLSLLSMRRFQGFVGVIVTLAYNSFSVSHQVCEGWMWSRVPKPWVSRREPAPRCSVIFPPLLTVFSGIARILGPLHPPVLHSFRGKAEWKIKCHDSP